jgi:hypothetical protein
MTTGNKWLLMVLTLLALGTTRCAPLNEGLRDGLSAGVKAALASLIETPIGAFLEGRFGG